MEKIAEEDIIFDEGPLTLEYEKFDKSNKNLRVEKVEVENKNIINQEHVDIDLYIIHTMGLIVSQKSTNEAITQSVANVLAKNYILKRKLK